MSAASNCNSGRHVAMARSKLYAHVLNAVVAPATDIRPLEKFIVTAERLAKVSTYWIRHSHASHAIAGGVPIKIAQQNLARASRATTTVYVTSEKRRRMKADEAFWKRKMGAANASCRLVRLVVTMGMPRPLTTSSSMQSMVARAISLALS